MPYYFGQEDVPEQHEGSETVDIGIPSPVLETLFHEGSTLVDGSGRELNTHVVYLGSLVIRSGRIVACDPYWATHDTPAFTTVVPAGTFPVVVSIAGSGIADDRVACAMLRFDEHVPVRWELALFPDGTACYNIETGTGCFMDVMLAQVLQPASTDSAEELEARALSALSRMRNVADALAAWRDLPHEQLHNPLVDALDQQLDQGRAVATWASANVTADSATGGNIIAFSTGHGDGCFYSFFGYDAQDRLVCLATNFEQLARS